jgi:hypothetical protein
MSKASKPAALATSPSVGQADKHEKDARPGRRHAIASSSSVDESQHCIATDEGGRGRKLDKDRCGRHHRLARYRTMTILQPDKTAKTATSHHHMSHDFISRGAEDTAVQTAPP